MDGHLTMREVDRLAVMTRLAERRVTQRRAAEQLGLSVRQVGRVYGAYRARGAPGLISGHRGRASNRRLANALQRQALALIRERYHDFGPTLAHEKLTEEHGLRLSVETLRQWMIEAALWVPRAQQARRSYQPRERRACVGELVQIDGCDHRWFEDRGPACTLLVYVDDATSRLMQLHFADAESTYDYFAATRGYLEQHGKPMAFYSDRASVFHIGATATRDTGLSQFGRALRELNIDSICANSAEAKGRVERAHLTLQDRLVKELRLRGLSCPVAAAAYLPTFIADYNRRFARPPREAYDAHRPLRADEPLETVFTVQEHRRITKQLTVNYKRGLYLLEDSVATRRLRGATAVVREDAGGTVTITCIGTVLPYRLHRRDTARVAPGAVVPHKRLGAVFAQIAAQQRERDAEHLASRKVSLREKKRIRAAVQAS